MALEDQTRWNKKYADGAYAQRLHPSRYLQLQLPQIVEFLGTGGRALDVACGSGRNSIYLAERGFAVEGVDISDVALKRASSRAIDLDLDVQFNQVDLDVTESLPGGGFDLIIMFRYVALDLLGVLANKLQPNGILVVEEHLLWHDSKLELAGPRSPRFRVEPGKMVNTIQQMDMLELHSFDGLIEEPDGSLAAVSRITAKKQ
ncbi:MAG: class I SAM-dependent methyltransferase [Pseudomonadota bacterium]